MLARFRPSSGFVFVVVVVALDVLLSGIAWLIGWPVFDPYNLFIVGIFGFGLSTAAALPVRLLLPPSPGDQHVSLPKGGGVVFKAVGLSTDERDFDEYKAEEGVSGPDLHELSDDSTPVAVVVAGTLVLGLVFASLVATVLGLVISSLR